MRFAFQFAWRFVLYAIVLFVIGVLFGCAGRRTAAAPRAPRFWQRCDEIIPAKADSFQHFYCSDVRGKHWEVLVRKGAR